MAQQMCKLFTLSGTDGVEKDIFLYSRSFLAYRLDKKKATLIKWMQYKMVPRPIFHINNSACWFCPDELLIYERAYAQDNVRGGISIDKTKFGVIVNAEIEYLRKRVQKEGVSFLKEDVSIEELNDIRSTCAWKRKG